MPRHPRPEVPHARALVLAVPVVAIALAAACTGPQSTAATWEEMGAHAETPVSTDAGANGEFAVATALYNEGRYAEALEAFRLFGAEHPGDPLAVHAEIHGARTLAAMGNTLEAEAAFRSLRTAPDSAETRATAALYVAFVGAMRGETEWARDVAADALAADANLRVPLGWVVPGDEALLASLLAEARIAAGARLAALTDLALVAREGEGPLADYAIDRGMEQADAVRDRRALQAANAGPDPFVAAVTAPALARLLREAGDVDGAREVLLVAELPAAEWGRPDRIAEEMELLAASGADRPARYGAALPLTGPSRRAGRAALGAILLAQRVFEDRPALSTVLVRDTGGSADGTRGAIEDLAAAGASVIIGPIDADLADVARDAASRVGVPLIALSPVAFDGGRDGSFRWLIDPAAEARAALTEAVARGVSTWAIVEESAPAAFFRTFSGEAATAIRESGGEVVERVSLTNDSGEPAATQEAARVVAQAVSATDAAGVLLALPDDLAATVAAYLASEDIWPSRDGATVSRSGRRQVTYVANSFVVTDALVRNSASYFDGAIIPYWFDAELATGPAREFADRFAFTYGRAPGAVEAFAFDAASGVRRLLLDEGITAPDHLAARLRAGVETGGAVGALRFAPDGNPDIEPRLCTVSGGRFVAR